MNIVDDVKRSIQPLGFGKLSVRSSTMKRRDFVKSTLIGVPLFSGGSLLSNAKTKSQKTSLPADSRRCRLRELGIKIGTLETGPHNAITDIQGVKVGHRTIVKGEGPKAVRTGVTAILPHEGNIWEENLFAAFFGLNGWGEMTGISSLEKTGRLETPVFLTGTYNVGIVYSAALKYLAALNPQMGNAAPLVSPVVAECFDDFLSDTKSRLVSEEDVLGALCQAKSGPVEEGAVGGGTGMTSFGFKGGIGTSSRKVPGGFCLGILVMANTGSRDYLRMDGVPVGKEIRGYQYRTEKTKSIILVAATDAPLLPYQLHKIAKRVGMGLAQTGSYSHTESGDLILAFSTGNKILRSEKHPLSSIRAIDDFSLSSLYQATVEATQEAILNALTSARTMTGRDGNTAYAIPLDQVLEIMKKYNRIGD
jgi:D-aminopeptidase